MSQTITSIGLIAIVLLCVIGAFVLSFHGKPVPDFIQMIAAGALGVVAPSPNQHKPLPAPEGTDPVAPQEKGN